MVSGRPMFPGSTAENELILIFKVCLIFSYCYCFYFALVVIQIEVFD